MHPCPHCGKEGISTLQKLCSVSFAPATCNQCSGLAYLHVVHGLKAMIMWVILTWVFISVALYTNMSIYLIGTIPAVFLAVDQYMLKAPMEAVH